MPIEVSHINLFVIVIGIVGEIIGFIFMLKYTQKPRYADIESWKARHENIQSKKEVFFRYRRDARTDYSEVEPVCYAPIEFLEFWEGEKKLGIFFIIGGLFLQLMQFVL